jgi:hypothetical protein
MKPRLSGHQIASPFHAWSRESSATPAQDATARRWTRKMRLTAREGRLKGSSAKCIAW